MANRDRTVRLQLLVSEKEADMIRQKMLQVGTANFSMYARKMLIDGYVIKRDFTELKALTNELANLARNINQIALRANETRSIYQQDIDDLKQYYGNVKCKASLYRAACENDRPRKLIFLQKPLVLSSSKSTYT